MLDGIDTLVIDLQDIGARFYTYMTTMAYAMEEAAKRKIPIVVLDRPNPIDGFQIEGPVLDKAQLSFIGYFPMPIRHGMTLGELARLFNAENKIGADQRSCRCRTGTAVVRRTGLPWVNPSPNMRNLNQATLYPGISAIEGTNLSVGRGPTPPSSRSARRGSTASRCPTRSTRAACRASVLSRRLPPASSKYAGEECRSMFDRHR
jgi:uncharacterized protein YbbC (DUF1343 family)